MWATNIIILCYQVKYTICDKSDKPVNLMSTRNKLEVKLKNILHNMMTASENKGKMTKTPLSFKIFRPLWDNFSLRP